MLMITLQTAAADRVVHRVGNAGVSGDKLKERLKKLRLEKLMLLYVMLIKLIDH